MQEFMSNTQKPKSGVECAKLLLIARSYHGSLSAQGKWIRGPGQSLRHHFGQVPCYGVRLCLYLI